MADLMRTSNPTLNGKVFTSLAGAPGETMTLNGTVNKTGILLLCTVATAAWITVDSRGPVVAIRSSSPATCARSVMSQAVMVTAVPDPASDAASVVSSVNSLTDASKSKCI